MGHDEFIPGSVVPVSMCQHIGAFVVQFAALEQEINRLIWRINGAGLTKGRAITASINNYWPRVQLGLRLASTMEDGSDKSKVRTLFKQFQAVAEYRNRILHDEATFYSPSTGTVGYWRATTHFQPSPPTHVSEQHLSFNTKLSLALMARAQQYNIGNPAWTENDEHFPWFDAPPEQP